MRSLAALLLAVTASACTTVEPYRIEAGHCMLPADFPPANGVASDSLPCAANHSMTLAGVANEHGDLPSLNFVEFTEQGHFHDRRQLEQVIDTVRSRGEQQDVVLFIHGWRHDARASDGDVQRFTTLLRQLARRNQSRTITGVYVGWRGAVTDVKPVDLLTFWDRKNVSTEVGRGALIELAQRLTMAADQKGNRLISIGHSFGGSVLLSATKNEIYKSVFQDLPTSAAKAASTGSGSNAVETKAAGLKQLTILINPAIEASHFLEIHDVIEQVGRTRPAAYRHPALPRMMVFASDGDDSVRKVFPLARRLGTLFESHKTLRRLDRHGQVTEFSELDMDIQALGQYPAFQTHRLEAMPGPQVSETCEVLPTSLNGQISGPGAEGWSARFAQSRTTLRHLGESPAFGPAWLVGVDEALIPNHSDIWTSAFSCFLEELVLLGANAQEGAAAEREAR